MTDAEQRAQEQTVKALIQIINSAVSREELFRRVYHYGREHNIGWRARGELAQQLHEPLANLSPDHCLNQGSSGSKEEYADTIATICLTGYSLGQVIPRTHPLPSSSLAPDGSVIPVHEIEKPPVDQERYAQLDALLGQGEGKGEALLVELDGKAANHFCWAKLVASKLAEKLSETTSKEEILCALKPVMASDGLNDMPIYSAAGTIWRQENGSAKIEKILEHLDSEHFPDGFADTDSLNDYLSGLAERLGVTFGRKVMPQDLSDDHMPLAMQELITSLLTKTAGMSPDSEPSWALPNEAWNLSQYAILAEKLSTATTKEEFLSAIAPVAQSDRFDESEKTFIIQAALEKIALRYGGKQYAHILLKAIDPQFDKELPYSYNPSYTDLAHHGALCLTHFASTTDIQPSWVLPDMDTTPVPNIKESYPREKTGASDSPGTTQYMPEHGWRNLDDEFKNAALYLLEERLPDAYPITFRDTQRGQDGEFVITKTEDNRWKVSRQEYEQPRSEPWKVAKPEALPYAEIAIDESELYVKYEDDSENTHSNFKRSVRRAAGQGPVPDDATAAALINAMTESLSEAREACITIAGADFNRTEENNIANEALLRCLYQFGSEHTGEDWTYEIANIAAIFMSTPRFPALDSAEAATWAFILSEGANPAKFTEGQEERRAELEGYRGVHLDRFLGKGPGKGAELLEELIAQDKEMQENAKPPLPELPNTNPEWNTEYNVPLTREELLAHRQEFEDRGYTIEKEGIEHPENIIISKGSIYAEFRPESPESFGVTYKRSTAWHTSADELNAILVAAIEAKNPSPPQTHIPSGGGGGGNGSHASRKADSISKGELAVAGGVAALTTFAGVMAQRKNKNAHPTQATDSQEKTSSKTSVFVKSAIALGAIITGALAVDALTGGKLIGKFRQ